MFERFDDPEPYTPPAAFQVKVTAEGRKRRRRRRTAMSGSAAFAVLALAAAPVIYLRQQAGELEHVDVAGLAPVSPQTTIPPTTQPGVEATTPDTEPPALSAPINVLVVGVDTRPDGDAVTGSRTDTIAVVRLDPNGPRLTVLSIPRDLYVPINGGGKDRINSALAQGRDALVATVGDTLGIEINHYMEIDFAGFARLVDLAGGVDVSFETPVRDRNTGFTADAGCAHLDGEQALAYVRQRYGLPRGDLDRVQRQQAVLRTLMQDSLHAEMRRDPEQVAGFLDERLRPSGVVVVMQARHLCMEMRGVRKAEALTTTRSLRGCFARAGDDSGAQHLPVAFRS